MNKEIRGLQPQTVWNYFAEICDIPHPSRHEEAIRKYIVSFAEEHGLEYVVDDANNIIIRKPAAVGMENRKGIILQSHLDMVPQKNSDKNFDFTKDPIEAYINGEWVTANGTTLGADNGMGIAATLAVLAAKDIKHGNIEALFTATEEDGMVGAFGLKAGLLKGDILMNLDSETEGELYVGCAGGLDANITMPAGEDVLECTTCNPIMIEVSGLKGGHSGMEIILQRANANKLMFRLLRIAINKYQNCMFKIDCGGLRNAIPREAKVWMMVHELDTDAFLKEVVEYEKLIQEEYKGIEDSISIKATIVERPKATFNKEFNDKIINAICAMPNGVVTMSTSMPGLVQTSSNLARVVSENGNVRMQCLIRSSVNSEKYNVADDITSVIELAGGVVELSGGYDGWKPNMESPILKTMTGSYEKLYGKKPEITAIHAGLECGIIGGVYPNLDMISFGPTIRYPHSPDEEVNIGSVGKFWDFLRYTLENAPVK